MTQTAWPTVAQVTEAFESQGLTAPDSLAVHIDAAVNRWQSLTGWNPYFPVSGAEKDDTPRTYFYDPPQFNNKTLWFTQPWESITTLKTGITPTYAGDTLVADTDYRLLPANRTFTSLPIIGVEFAKYPNGGWSSISITGVPGVAAIPDDVWLAVRDEAMRLAIIETMQGESTASEVRQGPITLKFDNDEGRSKLDRWSKQFSNVVNRHKRIAI